MTTDAVPTDAATPPADAPTSPGKLLMQARERAHMALEEFAKLTKLPTATLMALEADDFSSLHETVYVQGYYRKCARALGLDEAALLKLYQSRVQLTRPAPPARVRLAGGETSKSSSSSGGGFAGASAAIGIVACIALWFIYGQRRPVPAVFQPPITAPTTDAGSSLSSPVAAISNPARTVTAVGGSMPAPPPPAPGAVDDRTASAVSASLVSEASAASPQASSAGTLTLTFAETSWARVQDSSGKVLLNGLIPAGEQRLLDGVPPYAVALGNAPAVTLIYEGQPVDLSGRVRANSTANLSVPAAR